MLSIVSAKYKLASVTFEIQDAHKVSQPKSLHDLASMLWTWASKNVPKQLQAKVTELVAIDGYTDAPVGTINWYVPKEVDVNRVMPFIEKGIQEILQPLGVVVSGMTPERSGMFDAQVVRLNVTQNATTNQENLPSLHVNNFSANILIDMLNLTRSGPAEVDSPEIGMRIPTSSYGSIDARELLSRIPQARQKIDSFTVSPQTKTRTHEESSENIYDGGMPKERLSRHLDALEQLARRALQGDFVNPTIQWG